ncbi:chemotaxis protein CheW [Reinekea thalattae]|uniref:CheW-like domain-containing protein n=1 Tax=Reinekea thalattae TaxID=2593301 RepID=A0A5C8Z7D2_9GAMM|nr:chemotaxis protein CheW [Reinekea thalattae]TXR53214.1 hypothetical protein FME95_01180 [Reinekea thalattae]
MNRDKLTPDTEVLTQTAGSRLAVMSYLDDMLHEATTQAEEEEWVDDSILALTIVKPESAPVAQPETVEQVEEPAVQADQEPVEELSAQAFEALHEPEELVAELEPETFVAPEPVEPEVELQAEPEQSIEESHVAEFDMAPEPESEAALEAEPQAVEAELAEQDLSDEWLLDPEVQAKANRQLATPQAEPLAAVEMEPEAVVEQPAVEQPVVEPQVDVIETPAAIETPQVEAFVVTPEPIVTEPEVAEPVDYIDPEEDFDIAGVDLQAASAVPSWQENGQPEWGQSRFDCLVFTVNGLKLAVPLVLLGNIHPLDRELTYLYDQPDWFLGLLPIHQGRNIRVVNTTALVMPEKCTEDDKDNLKFAVSMHNSDWALGADSIEGSISLDPEIVKWRSNRTSRPWLAGTVTSEMCALIDIDGFAGILKG